jgi:hypothetical protein
MPDDIEQERMTMTDEQRQVFNQLCDELAAVLNKHAFSAILSYQQLLAATSILVVGVVRNVEKHHFTEDELKVVREFAVVYLTRLINTGDFMAECRDTPSGPVH